MSKITSDLCRLCLKESFTLHNIYSSHTTSGDLVYRVLNYVYDLEITPDDGLLTQICAPCKWKMFEFEVYKRNVHFARVEIVKLLSKLSPGSTGGCGSRETDGRPIESDSAQEMLPRENIEPKQEEGELLPDIVNETKILPGEESRQEESDLIVEDENQYSQFSDVKNSLNSWEDSDDTTDSLSVAESIDYIPEIKVEIWDNYEDVLEKGLRDDVVLTQESVSAQQTKSSVNVSKSKPSDSKASLCKRKEGFICDICKKSFPQKAYLGRHVRIHYDERPFSCTICDKKFKQNSGRYDHELRHLRHKMNVGESEKGTNKMLYSCDVCAKNFSSKKGLWSHSNLHTNKYKCNSCGKCFGNNADLRRHFRTHTKEKPFKCEVCSKCVSRKSDLNRHLLIHSSERPYLCEICDHRFKSKREKAQHELHHLRKI